MATAHDRWRLRNRLCTLHEMVRRILATVAGIADGHHRSVQRVSAFVRTSYATGRDRICRLDGHRSGRHGHSWGHYPGGFHGADESALHSFDSDRGHRTQARLRKLSQLPRETVFPSAHYLQCRSSVSPYGTRLVDSPASSGAEIATRPRTNSRIQCNVDRGPLAEV